MAGPIAAGDTNAQHDRRAFDLGIADVVFSGSALAERDADVIVLSVLIAATAAVAAEIGPRLEADAILTDVCSTKAGMTRGLAPQSPSGVHFVPGHPTAGTEFSEF
jgi:prephenate dehydrogenase